MNSSHSFSPAKFRTCGFSVDTPANVTALIAARQSVINLHCTVQIKFLHTHHQQYTAADHWPEAAVPDILRKRHNTAQDDMRYGIFLIKRRHLLIHMRQFTYEELGLRQEIALVQNQLALRSMATTCINCFYEASEMEMT